MKNNYKEGMFVMKDCRISITIDNGKWHLSISKQRSLPTYNELKEARYKYLPNEVYMAQIFPPKE